MIRRVLVAGGGTGGHLFPGLAVVNELRNRADDVEVLFVGTARGIEARLLPARGERLELLKVTPLKGQGSLARAKSVARLPLAFSKAASIVRSFNPDIVIGVGGYAAGPVLAAAAAMGVKTALLEQNAHVGLTNKMLASVVGRAYLTFEKTVHHFGESKARVCGNPVRREFVSVARRAAADPEGFESRANSILILGGSQGAKALNEAVPSVLAEVDLKSRGLKIVHQTGEAMRDAVQERYRELGVEAEVVSFIDDMARVYVNATLVIARAGATTLAEVCAIGRPSVLIPFPHAADDHQTKNAQALEELDAAQCVAESDIADGALLTSIVELIESPVLRQTMAEAARVQGRPDAAAEIVDDMLAWVCNGGQATSESPIGTASEPSSSEPSIQNKGLRGARPYVPVRRTTMTRMSQKRVVWVDDRIWE